MLKRAIKHCKEKGIRLIICERSLQTDKNVFCKMLYDSGKIEDINFQIYNKWFDEFISEIPLIYFVYIKTEPKIGNHIKHRPQGSCSLPWKCSLMRMSRRLLPLPFLEASSKYVQLVSGAVEGNRGKDHSQSWTAWSGHGQGVAKYLVAGLKGMTFNSSQPVHPVVNR